jgi:hypothetical protein
VEQYRGIRFLEASWIMLTKDCGRLRNLQVWSVQ